MGVSEANADATVPAIAFHPVTQTKKPQEPSAEPDSFGAEAAATTFMLPALFPNGALAVNE